MSMPLPLHLKVKKVIFRDNPTRVTNDSGGVANVSTNAGNGAGGRLLQ